MSQNALVHTPEIETRPVLTPMAIIERALTLNPTPETLTKLMELHERWEANQARKAFDEAMAAAQGEIEPVRKNREVDFTSQKGRTNYRYEDLAEVERTVKPILFKHGLSYRFRTSSKPNEPVSVTCIISHRMGHSEENSLEAGRDDSGNKNSIQQISSTVTYLERITLKAALGLSATNDDDGKGSEAPPDGPISDEQSAMIRKMAEETGTDIPKFCDYLKAESIPAIPVSQFKRAVAALEKKRRAK